MKKQDVTTLLIIIAVLITMSGIAFVYTEHLKRMKAEEDKKKSQEEYQKLFLLYLEKDKTLPDEIKKQFKDFIEKYSGIEPGIAVELRTILNLIENKQEEIAIEKLTKVIEDHLKNKYVQEGKAKDKQSCPRLSKLLKIALDLKWISEHEFYVSLFLKDKRNEEAHQVGTKFPMNWKSIAFLAGIELLYNLKGIKREPDTVPA